MQNPFNDPDVVIHRYTRKQAIDDGVLVDVTEWASPREMMGGFRIPVAMTAAVWGHVQAPEDSCESTRGRAHDVLWGALERGRKRPITCRVAGRTHPYLGQTDHCPRELTGTEAALTVPKPTTC